MRTKYTLATGPRLCYLCYRLSYAVMITVTTNDPPTQATSVPHTHPQGCTSRSLSQRNLATSPCCFPLSCPFPVPRAAAGFLWFCRRLPLGE